MTSSTVLNTILRSVRGTNADVEDPQPIESEVSSGPSTTDGESEGDAQGSSYGIHGLLKKTDFWFSLELNELEKTAKTKAEEHAQAGLPRTDVPIVDELPAETVLRERAKRVYLDWSERVKRKVQDAIHAAADSAIGRLAELRHTYGQLEATKQKIEITERLIAQRSEDAGRNRTFEYGKLLKRWIYFAVIGLLVVVDWVANVPVFQQLLPQEPGVEQAWMDLSDSASRFTYLAGTVRLVARILFQPEVALLAFGVVTFLMLLGHFTGGSLRRIVSFRPKDETASVLGLKSHRRQAWTPFIGGICGIVLVVCFLYFSRAKLASVTDQRLEAAHHEVESVESDLHAAQAANNPDLDKVQTLERKLTDAQNVQDVRRQAADYSVSISAMNPGIFLLNVTLVIVATLAAYLESSASISEARWADPGISGLQRDLDDARAEFLSQRQLIRRLTTDIQLDVARARYLAQSLPLRDWEGKAHRLESVIPFFRSENARVRGIDVQNIAAFREPCRPLDLPILVSEPFEVPPQVDVCERDFSDLRAQMYASGVAE
jgi:hypothetical protein